MREGQGGGKGGGGEMLGKRIERACKFGSGGAMKGVEKEWKWCKEGMSGNADKIDCNMWCGEGMQGKQRREDERETEKMQRAVQGRCR